MTTLRLYRGIAVASSTLSDTVSSIVATGLTKEKKGHWSIEQSWGLPIDALLQKVDLSTCDTRSGSVSRPAICASGTEDGAAHYAWPRNQTSRDDAPILMEFDVESNKVAIDGKDFLYTAFQQGIPEKARRVLESLFGPKVLTYAEAAWASACQDRRIALCDLASMDAEVVAAHYRNPLVIHGRSRTVFENAFTVALPIRPDAIVRVWSPNSRPAQRAPSVTLADIM